MKRYPVVFLFSIFLCSCTFAEIDSSWYFIQKMPLNQSKLETALDWIYSQKIPQWDTAWIPMADELRKWSDQMESPYIRARLEHRMTNYYNYHQKREAAHSCLITGLRFAKKADDFELLAKSYRDYGVHYKNTAEIDSAIHYFQLSGQMFRSAGRLDELWKSLIPRAAIQADSRNNKLADELYEASWQSVKSQESRASRGFVLFLSLQHFARTENNELFDRYFDIWEAFKAERKTELSPQVKKLHANTLSFFSNDFKSAEREILSGIQYHRNQKNRIKLALFYLSLAQLYQQNERGEDALKAVINAENYYLLSKRDEPMLRSDIYKVKYEVYKMLDNDKEGLKSLEIFAHYKDSLTLIGIEKQLQNLEKQFESQSLEAELKQKESSLKAIKVQKQLLIFSLVSILFTGSFIFYFFRKLSVAREEVALKEHALQEKIIEDLTKQKQVTSLHAMLEGQEKERLRIARDLHDGLGSYLTSIKVNFNELYSADINNSHGQKLNELIDQACDEVRKVSHNMMPHALTLSGLEGAIEDLTETLHKNGIDADLEILGDFSGLEEKKAITLYRILQELVTNIVKHAGATHTLIQMIHHGHEISLIVEDNGCGFDQSILKDGIGLANLDARIIFLGGFVDVDSTVGEGTTITIRIPIK